MKKAVQVYTKTKLKAPKMRREQQFWCHSLAEKNRKNAHTVEPQYSGHWIKRPPHYYSHLIATNVWPMHVGGCNNEVQLARQFSKTIDVSGFKNKTRLLRPAVTSPPFPYFCVLLLPGLCETTGHPSRRKDGDVVGTSDHSTFLLGRLSTPEQPPRSPHLYHVVIYRHI